MIPGLATSHVTLELLEIDFRVFPVSLDVKLQSDLLNIDEPPLANCEGSN